MFEVILRWIRYYGFSAEEFSEASTGVIKNNEEVMRPFGALVALFSVVSCLVDFTFLSFICSLPMAVLGLLLFLLPRSDKRSLHVLKEVIAFALAIIVLCASVYISVYLSPHSKGVTAPVLVLLVAIFFVGHQYLVTFMVASASFAFAFLSFTYKIPVYAQADVTNAIGFGCVAVAAHFILGHMRINALVKGNETEALLLQQHKQQDEQTQIMNAIPGTLITFGTIPDERQTFPALSATPGIEDLIGYTVDEFLEFYTSTPREVFYEQDIPRIMNAMLRCVEGKERLDETYRIWHKNGTVVWTHEFAEVIVDHTGKRVVVASFQNVSAEAQLYKEIIDESSNVIVVRDLETLEVYHANSAAARISGRSEFSGLHCYEYLLDRSTPCENCPRADAQNDAQHEMEIGNTGHIYEVTSKRVMWHGRPAVAEYIVDVTEHREAAEAFETFVRTALQLNPGSICSFRFNLSNDTREKGTSIRPAIAEISNVLSFSEFIAALSELLSDAHDARNINEKFSLENLKQHYARGENSVECSIHTVTKSGEIAVYSAQARMMLNPSTDEIEGAFFIIDVSEDTLTRQITDKIMDDHFALTALLDLESGIYHLKQLAIDEMRPFIDQGGSIAYSKLLKEATESITHPDDRELLLERGASDAIRAGLEESDVYLLTTRNTIKGEIRVLKHSFTYLYFSRHIVLCTVEDVTDMVDAQQRQNRRLQEALDEARAASEAKTSFLGKMSHELRTPMNAIMGLTHLASDVDSNPAKTEEYLERIDYSSAYMLGVINDILEMSRIEAGQLKLDPAWIPSDRVISNCIDMTIPLMESKNIEFTYPESVAGHAQSPFEYFVDQQKLSQVIMNLLNNACKYTPEGGHVSLTINHLWHNEVESSEQLIVTDDGIGMSEEFLEHAFSPFEQERRDGMGSVQGTGLGLPLTREIVRAMGGDVTVESKLGEGSVFTVTLVTKYRAATESDSPSGTADEKPPIDYSPLDGAHVLVVEDNAINAEITMAILKEKGMVVTLAEDGIVAIEKVKDAPVGTFDAVLMDIRMPRMDGLEATRLIRGLAQGTAALLPIIAMSANAFDVDVKASLDAGMDEHLAKPVDSDALFEALVRYIGACRS